MSELSLDQWMHDLQSDQSFLDEETLISMVEKRVEELMADNPDLLFSFLYRLDVDEHKIQSALHKGDHIARALATLIVQRQKVRLDTKIKYRRDQKEGDTSSFDPVDY
jgi:histone deacetylase complex regulatory component SIN3